VTLPLPKSLISLAYQGLAAGVWQSSAASGRRADRRCDAGQAGCGCIWIVIPFPGFHAPE
jgi:hypothetical protein